MPTPHPTLSPTRHQHSTPHPSPPTNRRILPHRIPTASRRPSNTKPRFSKSPTPPHTTLLTGNGNNNIPHLNTVTSHWHNTVGNGPASGDFNSDGYVDDADLNAVLANWQQHGIALPTQWTVSQRLVYTVHGEFAAFDGDFNTGVNFLGWQPTFKGGMQDALTGNINFRMRDYNPRTMTWNTKDPLGFVDGLNLYQFVVGNPVNSVDPTGLRRYIFAFEGLFGFNADSWQHFRRGDQKWLQVGGGTVLRAILNGMSDNHMDRPGAGASGGEGQYQGADPNFDGDTVLSYYGWTMNNVNRAVEYAASLHPDQPHTVRRNGGSLANDGLTCKWYDTYIVVGHSFGGNAAWLFANKLHAKFPSVKVDLVFTFDPRSPSKEGLGGNEESLNIQNGIGMGPFTSAIDAANRWQNGIPDWPLLGPLKFANLTGYPLKIADDRMIPNSSHFGVVQDGGGDLLKRIKNIGIYRQSSDSNKYVE